MNWTDVTRTTIIIVLFSLIGLCVMAYNIWSYSCGHCTVQTFLNPGIPGAILLFSIVFASGVYIYVRHRRIVLERRALCACGEQMGTDWQYCVACGARCE